MPRFEEFVELTMRSFYWFEELKNIWARDIRNRPTGNAFLRHADNPYIHDVKVKRSPAGISLGPWINSAKVSGWPQMK